MLTINYQNPCRLIKIVMQQNYFTLEISEISLVVVSLVLNLFFLKVFDLPLNKGIHS